jgi:DNA-binding response OmpR family regulator
MTLVKKVLVAEDDQFLKKIYESKFAKAGFEVKVAGDGVEALSILQSFQPHIILLDVIMPKKDGFDTLKELRANAKWQKIPILILSNLGQLEDKKKALALGATDYLVKSEMPIQELIQMVESKIA